MVLCYNTSGWSPVLMNCQRIGIRWGSAILCPLIPTKYTIYLFIIFIGVGNMQTKSDVFVMIKKEQYEKNKKN